MLPQSILILTVTLLAIFSTNCQVNPYFSCDSYLHSEVNSYNITLNRNDEIVLNNCNASTINEIIHHLRQSRLIGRPLRLNMASVNLTGLDFVNVTEIDLSDNDLSKIDLREVKFSFTLNLTYNNFHTFDALQLCNDSILHSLDMSHNRLVRLQGKSIPFTKKLFLRSNNIMELDTHFILPDTLIELDLTRNEIENISLVNFTSSNLRILNLSINLINAISKQTFSRLPSLQTLLLECNKIFDLEIGTFSSNTKLIELNLRDNNISILKKGVFDNLVNLQILDVSKNRLLRLTPDNIQNLNNLVHFSFSGNMKLCQNQCKRDLQFLLMLGGRLKTLKMSRLRLRYFPVTLTTSIRILDLSGNKLSSIRTGDLENFPLLEVLDLSANEIALTEHDVFFRMEYLQELYLHDNLLQQIPNSLPQSLRILHLQRNRITNIRSTDFQNLSNLNTLKLNSNLIKTIESQAFMSLRNLKFFDISHNPLQHLGTEAFEGANNVETFYASHLHNININATDLRYFPISELPNLRYLNLSHSPELARSFLFDIPLLITIKQLEVLDLDNTSLVTIPNHLEYFLTHIKMLRILENPMNCTDNMYGEWKEPYRLKKQRFNKNNNNGDFKIRITRRFSPPFDRVTILSRCSLDFEFIVIPKYDFWTAVKDKPNVSDMAASASNKRNLFEWLTESTPNDTNSLISRRRNCSAVSSSTTPQTIIGSTFYDVRPQAIISATASHELASRSPPPNLNTARNFIFKLPSEKSSPPFSNDSFLQQNAAPLVWNVSRKDERGFFFDWFPSLNESVSDPARLAASEGSGRGSLQYTHLGLIIFSFLFSFIIIAFSSFIVSHCIQTYKWKWHRYQMSQFDNEYPPNIEISSISACVETEINSE